MSTFLVNGGFTAYALLGVPNHETRKLSLTGFGIEFNKNKLISSGVWRYAYDVTDIRRTQGPYYQDVPLISLSISFEPDKDLLISIMEVLASKRNEAFSVAFYDMDSKIDWIFNECYVTSINFSTSPDTILSVSIEFVLHEEEVLYSWGQRDTLSGADGTGLPFYGEGALPMPMPYYSWHLYENGSEIEDVTQFSLSFQQPITPKYECSGSSSTTAKAAEYFLFGLPGIEFSMSKFMYLPDGADFNDDRRGTFMQDFDSDFSASSIGLYFGEPLSPELVCRLTGLSVASISPSFIGSYCEYSINYDVHGILRS